jgi:hypothetical protein
VLLAWVVLSTLTQLPYAQAWLVPPAGTSFVGFFYYVDDQYNYLSYVEQAERGALLFENKLVLEAHAPTLVNLEWLVVGRLSRLLGGHPFLAYRLLALGASLGLLAGVDRCLRTGGLPASHRFPALLLSGLAGGFGGLAWKLGWLPLPLALDLTTGAFPFVELLANPHFAAGTALLIWCLWRLTTASRPLEHAQGVLLGTTLGLVRPYDLMLVGASRLVGVLATEPIRRWPAALAPLLGFVPVLAYNAWVFHVVPSFGSFGLSYVKPSSAALALAMGPATALACLTLRRWPSEHGAKAMHVHLLAWAIAALAIVTLHPVGFSLQFLVGSATPLLILAGMGLHRLPRAALLLATLVLCSSSITALSIVLARNPRWYAPSERVGAATALRQSCREGETLMAPQDIGLYALGRSACRAYSSHVVEPGHDRRLDTVAAFYGPMAPAARGELLARLGITELVLPGDAGEAPTAWLGPETPFRRQSSIAGPYGSVSVYACR